MKKRLIAFVIVPVLIVMSAQAATVAFCRSRPLDALYMIAVAEDMIGMSRFCIPGNVYDASPREAMKVIDRLRD